MDAELSMYEVNQQLMAKLPILKTDAIETVLVDLFVWMVKDNSDTSFMFLCHELRDYTIFQLAGGSIFEFTNEFEDCLESRGDLVDLSFHHGAAHIWIRQLETREDHLYVMFPYDEGVIAI